MLAGRMEKVLVTLVVVFCSIIPFAFADETTIIDSGECGTNVEWELRSDGTLNIFGTGTMNNYACSCSYSMGDGDISLTIGDIDTPWYSYRATITSISLQSGVTGIGNNAFAGCYMLESISLPDSMISIGNNAFIGCNKLTCISFPSSVKYIGDHIFAGCTSLISASFSDNINSIKDGTFYGCENLANFVIPNKSTSIGEGAFYACKKLNSISIPTSVTTLDDYAFAGCSSITNIVVPSSVTSIGSSAFAGCSSMTSIVLPENITVIPDYVFRKCTSLTSITIPSNVTSIGWEAFGGCENLQCITFPDSIKKIEYAAFDYCYSLEDVYVPSIEAWINISFNDLYSNPMSYAENLHVGGNLLVNARIPDGVTSIGNYAFYGCNSLTSIILPEGVISIGDYAFGECNNLPAVILPEDLKYIGNAAFSGCVNLTNINIPSSVIEIGSSAFNNCRSLSNVTIPDGITNIADYTFASCENLTSITLPDSLQSISSSAFTECKRLRHIVLPGNEVPQYKLSRLSDAYTVYCYEFTSIDYWATENGYCTVYLDSVTTNDLIDFSLTFNCWDYGYSSYNNGEAVEITVTVPVGGKFTVVPCMFPNIDDPEIIWISSAPDIAITADGVVTAVSTGNAIITAICGNKSASIGVEVYVTADDFHFDTEEIWMIAKETQQVTLEVRPTDAKTAFGYSYDDENIDVERASIDGTYSLNIIGKVPGDTEIVMTDHNSGICRTCKVHVFYPVTEIEFVNPSYQVLNGDNLQLIANVTARNQTTTNKLVTFSSSDETVAMIDENGLVTAVGEGIITITATASSGVTASCEITVRNLSVLMLPAELQCIEAEAFVNTGIEKVVLPNGCMSIGERAFADNESLLFVYMPDSVTSIAVDAFDGCSNVSFICESENESSLYAEMHGIPWVIE